MKAVHVGLHQALKKLEFGETLVRVPLPLTAQTNSDARQYYLKYAKMLAARKQIEVSLRTMRIAGTVEMLVALK